MRGRADGLELPLGPPGAAAGGFGARERVGVSLALAGIDVETGHDEVSDARRVSRCRHRGERAADREADDVDAIDVQPSAQRIDDGAHVGHALREGDGRGIGPERLAGAALVPVGDDPLRLQMQPPLEHARVLNERKAGPLLHDQQDTFRGEVAAQEHPLPATVDREGFEGVDGSRAHDRPSSEGFATAARWRETLIRTSGTDSMNAAPSTVAAA